MIILNFDPGQVTGWAAFDGEKLLRFGQIAVNARTNIPERIGDVLNGRTGYPGVNGETLDTRTPYRFPLKPTLAIIEEHLAYYSTKHAGEVGENRLKTTMRTNVQTRHRLVNALLQCGIPSIGITGDEWGAARYTIAEARAELQAAGIPEPENFDIPHREHQRDAIVMGGRCIRRRIWEAV